MYVPAICSSVSWSAYADKHALLHQYCCAVKIAESQNIQRVSQKNWTLLVFVVILENIASADSAVKL